MVIVLKCNSKFREQYRIDEDQIIFKSKDSVRLQLEYITDNGNIKAYKYKRVYGTTSGKPIQLCPEENTREAFKVMIMDNPGWFDFCVVKGIDEKTSTHESIKRMIDWVVEDRKKRNLPIAE